MLDTRPQIGAQNPCCEELLDTSSHTPLIPVTLGGKCSVEPGQTHATRGTKVPNLKRLENQFHGDGDVAGGTALHIERHSKDAARLTLHAFTNNDLLTIGGHGVARNCALQIAFERCICRHAGRDDHRAVDATHMCNKLPRSVIANGIEHRSGEDSSVAASGFARRCVHEPLRFSGEYPHVDGHCD